MFARPISLSVNISQNGWFKARHAARVWSNF